MVDTIMFRIHDLERNKGLVEYLNKLYQGKQKFVKVLDEKVDFKREIYVRNFYKDYATGNTYSGGYQGFIASHHYNAVYYINTNKGYIEFNVSLPKYYFGNNVLQLVDHFHETYHLTYRVKAFNELTVNHFDWFRRILKLFLLKELNVDESVSSYIEIVRLDICYNMIFNCKEDAVYYLGQMKHIRRKKLSTTNPGTPYKDGIYYPGDAFTVKIYHKGPEFKVHDFRKVKKKFGEPVANKLKAIGDHMLRFEVEFRKAALTDLFRGWLKTERPTIYTCIHYARTMSARGYISEDRKKYNSDGLSMHNGEYVKGRCETISPIMHKRLKVGQSLINKDLNFFLENGSEISLLSVGEMEDLDQYRFVECFDINVFSLVMKKFTEIFYSFQVGDLNKLNSINALIKEKKSESIKSEIRLKSGMDMTSHISMGRMKMFIDLLQDHTWDEIRQKDIFPRSVFYRYKKHFKLLDSKMGEYNSSYNFRLSFDYSNYFNLILPAWGELVPNYKFLVTPTK